MKIKQTLLPLIVPFILVACSFFKEASLKQGEGHNSSNYEHQDSVIKQNNVLHSDSIDAIMKQSDKSVLYEMAGLVVDTSKRYHSKDSLFNYRIERNIGLIDQKMQNILVFIIEDTTRYISNYTPIRQPFHPDIVIEFIHKKQRAYYYVSFATREIAISDEKGIFKFYLFKDLHLLLRWTHIMLLDNDYFNQ